MPDPATELSNDSPPPSIPNLLSFFERLKTLSDIRRFGTHPMLHTETVSGHCFNVAIMALLTADAEENTTLDRESLLRKALFHDFEETLLSDIPHPIKHRLFGGKLGHMLKQLVPALIEEEIFKELPLKLREPCIRDAKEAKEGPEGRIVRAADAMDIVVTAIREQRLGNTYFDEIFEKGMEMLEEYRDLNFPRSFIEAAEQYRLEKTKVKKP